MKKAFFINGGAGRVLCAIPALEAYKQNVDPDVVIVAESWPELYLTSDIIRENVFNINHKNLFEDKLLDKQIISPEPYRLNEYYNQKCNLIQAFDIIINDLKEIPKPKEINLTLSKNDQLFGYNIVEQAKKAAGKDKAIIFQPFGAGVTVNGDIIVDSSGRSFELSDVYKILERLKKDYAVIIMSTIEIQSDDLIGVFWPQNLTLLQWMGIIKTADYFLGCDSVGQHFANALDKPSTVVFGSTYPENISYLNKKNFIIIDNGKAKRKYSPIRILQDIETDIGNEDLMILENNTYDKIIKTVVDKLGKPQNKNITPFNNFTNNK